MGITRPEGYFDGKSTKLELSIVGENQFDPVRAAFNEFSAPFEYFLPLINPNTNFENFVYALTYSDVIWKTIQHEHFLNFYPIINATKFEDSGLIMNWLSDGENQDSFQSVTEQISNDAGGVFWRFFEYLAMFSEGWRTVTGRLLDRKEVFDTWWGPTKEDWKHYAESSKSGLHFG